ncbi:hypothetical protein QEH59_17150 [Coraliomargarita sp. SDUM461004]|uniref:Uncharacterized protein n=1 Tax=Thalassobacterium sedimentorum TaxID=3041258 RepID=A0ABU1AMZ5_9BACT|nr:hypothetical protein [Coraliomargarita sp. SDUM461004]MDQ8196166.1 hypothetical protein [Coraliomargarita sp. SDUM461004]
MYPKFTYSHLLRNTAALWLLILITCSPAHAQESTINCRFRILGWENVPHELYLNFNSDYKKIEIGRNHLSDYYAYRGTRTLTFYSEIPTIDVNAPQTPPVATLNLTKTNQDYILLVLPQNGKKGFRILSIEDNTTALPYGSLTLVNVTPAILGVILSETNSQVPPLDQVIVPLPKPESPERRRQKIPFQVYWKSPEGWEILRSATIFVPARSNKFLFFHKPVWQDGMNTYVNDPIQWTILSR